MRKIFIFLSFFILILTFSSCNKTPSETISPTITQEETTEPTTENIPTVEETPTLEQTPTVEETPNIPTENEIDYSKLSMACIGDSITWGYEGNLNTPMSFPLPNEIKNILNLKSVDNYGICGSTLSSSVEDDMWARIQTYNKHYDIIYVFGGVNDLNLNCPLGDINSLDTNTIYGALNNITMNLKTNYPNSYIFYITPLKCHRSDLSYTFPNKIGVNLVDIANAIKEVGNLNNIPVLDLYFESAFNPSTDSYNNDGVHPTQDFVKTSLAPQIAHFIKENYKENNIPTTEDTPTFEETPNIPTENEIDFSKLSYCAFGDSITAGGGLSSKNLSYPNMTAKILGTSITNKGVSGSTIGYDTKDTKRHCIADDVITYCKQNYKADIISFTGGSNDKGRLIPLGAIDDNDNLSVYGSLNIIANTLKERYPNAFIFFMTPIKNPTCEEPNKLNYTLNDICIAIKQVAQKYDIPVLDLYNESNFESVDCGMYAEGCDGWHPLKDYVRDYMAPQIAQFIKDNYKENNNSTIPNNEYMHISFDDVSTCFNNLTTNNYNSLFDEPFFNKLLFLHNKYDAKFSLYTYNTVLNNVPDKYKNDFTNSSDWLKIGFHSNSSGLNLSNTTYEQGFEYWNSFVNNVIRICGSADSIDRMPRLEFFSGSLEALLGMKNASYGALGFLSADDNRLSYYFNNDMMSHLYDNNYLIDEENNLTFISTDIRCDWFYNFSSNNNYKAPIKDNVYDELTYRYTNSKLKYSFTNMIIFTHEWLVYNGQTINSKFDSIIDACRFAEEYNIKFNYAQNITYTD